MLPLSRTLGWKATVLIAWKHIWSQARMRQLRRTLTNLKLKLWTLWETRFGDTIDRVETGFYDTKKIHILAVDMLYQVQNTETKEAGSVIKLPSVETL
jgi:hypothetical protein